MPLVIFGIVCVYIMGLVTLVPVVFIRRKFHAKRDGALHSCLRIIAKSLGNIENDAQQLTDIRSNEPTSDRYANRCRAFIDSASTLGINAPEYPQFSENANREKWRLFLKHVEGAETVTTLKKRIRRSSRLP